jgi:hypothetical protein
MSLGINKAVSEQRGQTVEMEGCMKKLRSGKSWYKFTAGENGLAFDSHTFRELSRTNVSPNDRGSWISVEVVGFKLVCLTLHRSGNAIVG